LATDASALGGVPPSGYIQNTTTTQAGSNFSIDGSGTLGGALNLSPTTGASVGVINLGGSPFIHACCGNGNANTFVGLGAGNLINTAIDNTASGFNALHSDTSGGANTANGWNALFNNTTG